MPSSSVPRLHANADALAAYRTGGRCLAMQLPVAHADKTTDSDEDADITVPATPEVASLLTTATAHSTRGLLNQAHLAASQAREMLSPLVPDVLAATLAHLCLSPADTNMLAAAGPPASIRASDTPAASDVLQPRVNAAIHEAIGCDECNMSPIVGVRYRKVPASSDKDLCEICFNKLHTAAKSSYEALTNPLTNVAVKRPRRADAGGDVASDIFRDQLKEHLTCRICLDIFDNPHSLPCQHVFCKICVLTHFRTAALMVCPLCKLPSQPREVSHNHVLHSIVELHHGSHEMS